MTSEQATVSSIAHKDEVTWEVTDGKKLELELPLFDIDEDTLVLQETAEGWAMGGLAHDPHHTENPLGDDSWRLLTRRRGDPTCDECL